MDSVLDVKPIMYGVLSSTSMIDFEGYLSKVFFTAGCNFRCGFCHNGEMIHASQGHLQWEEIAGLLESAKEEWVDAVVITGGEPTIHKNLPEVISWFKEQGFSVKLDTNGSLPHRLEKVIDMVDYIAMDCKASRASYSILAGVEINTDAIAESLRLLQERACGKYEIRTTIVRPLHDEEEMKTIAEELEGTEKYLLQPFVPQESLYDPSFSQLERTDAGYLEKMKEIVDPYIPHTYIRGVGQ